MTDAYVEYREGISWAPDLPSHWRAVSLRWLADIYAGGTPDKENLGYWTDGTIPWLNSGSVNGWAITQPSALITDEAYARSSAKWVPAKSVVMGLAGQGKTKGTAARLEFEATTNQSMAAIVPCPALDYRFLHFWLVANYQSIRNLAGGDLRDGLNLQHVASIQVPLPPLQEQRSIADYLDRETSRIDTLIEEQQRLIDMLRERREALIERTLLDSADAPIRLSRIASSRSGDVPPPLEEDGQYVVWGAGRVVGHTSQVNAQAGDLLIGRVGQGSVGKVRRLTEAAWATDNTIVLRLDSSVADPRYVEHGLRLIPRFELVGGGAMPLVTAERLLAQPVPFTTLRTQRRIADYLGQQTAKIDLLIKETERFIDLSRERRAALITAAVTGQIDVREMV